jgi:hypothetical protein
MYQLIQAGFRQVNNRLDTITVTQADINNAVTGVTNLLQDVSTQAGTIVTDIAAIKTALWNGEPVDTSQLDAIMSTAQAAQDALDTATSSLSSVANPPATPPTTPTPPAS